MRAILLSRHGPPSVLKVRQVPDPVPRRGEVRVRLRYIGLNFAEIQSRKGLYEWSPRLPYILGMEGYGEIDVLGEGVEDRQVGEPVIVATQYGTYADFIVVPQEQAIPAVEEFTAEENAGFLVNYATAWVGLFEMARLQPSDSVLIQAAAGGVGTAAVQLAKHYGCRVFGTVSRDGKIESLSQYNIDGVVNYAKQDFETEIRRMQGGLGVDVILEVVGGEVFRKSLRLLNPFGRVVVMGFASLDLKKWNPVSWWRTWRDIPRVKVNWLAKHSSGILSSHLGYLLPDAERLRKVMSNLRAFVADKNIRPLVGRVFGFEEMHLAHEYIESRKSVGKVVVKL